MNRTEQTNKVPEIGDEIVLLPDGVVGPCTFIDHDLKGFWVEERKGVEVHRWVKDNGSRPIMGWTFLKDLDAGCLDLGFEDAFLRGFVFSDAPDHKSIEDSLTCEVKALRATIALQKTKFKNKIKGLERALERRHQRSKELIKVRDELIKALEETDGPKHNFSGPCTRFPKDGDKIEIRAIFDDDDGPWDRATVASVMDDGFSFTNDNDPTKCRSRTTYEGFPFPWRFAANTSKTSSLARTPKDLKIGDHILIWRDETGIGWVDAVVGVIDRKKSRFWTSDNIEVRLRLSRTNTEGFLITWKFPENL